MEADDRPHLFNLQTTLQVLRYASLTFGSSLHTFLVVSLLIFSYHFSSQLIMHDVYDYLQENAALKSLLQRMTIVSSQSDLSDHFDSTPSDSHHGYRRKRQMFVYTNPIDDVDGEFTTELAERRYVFTHHLRFAEKSNIFTSHLGRFASNLSFFSMLKFDEIWIAGGHKPAALFFDRADSRVQIFKEENQGNHPPGLESISHTLNLDPHETTTLLSAFFFVCLAYGWMILGYLFSYSFTLGVVLVVVIDGILQRHRRLHVTLLDGFRFGVNKLFSFVVLTWSVRDFLVQLIGLMFFSHVHNKISLIELFLWLKNFPVSLSLLAPPKNLIIRGADISGFKMCWVLCDVLLSLVSSVGCWVAALDSWRTGQETFREGGYLLSIVLHLSVRIKCFQVILCGSLMNQLLSSIGGNAFSLFVQSVAEVYFMVAWLAVYLSARAKDAELRRMRFGRTELQDIFDNIG